MVVLLEADDHIHQGRMINRGWLLIMEAQQD
jgi:hypothetical protein